MNERPEPPISSSELTYSYGSDKYAVCYIAAQDADVQLIEKTVDGLAPPKPMPVICDPTGLSTKFTHPKVEVITYDEFARRGIPLVIIANESAEARVEAHCRELYQRTRAIFGIYDPYQPSYVVSAPMQRRYRDVTLHLETSTLFPTLYSNWDYINILLSEIGRGTGDVLDMFAGSGVIGFCLKREAPIRSISLCDVNYWAVRSMRRTVAADRALSGEIWLSEGVMGIPSTAQFDLIVGNPPHTNAPLQGPHMLPGFDFQWEAHDLFFQNAHKHLRPGGRVLFTESKGSGVYEQYYQSLPHKYPQYRLGRYIDQRNHICFVMEVLLAKSRWFS